MKFLRSKRGLAVLGLILIILFLFRPGVRVLRERIARSIGSALGRRVALDNVRIHVLPRPGFDLEGLVIYDDPAFSAEPMVRAQDVSAAIRFRSLFRGRLEIATLSANEPSINLVRNDQGRWNLAGLLERSAHIPVAPTGKPASEKRPAFPYLEATNARINFKIGQAKKSWSLTDGDVALWQADENTWGARLKAQPVRTDFNLTDTGIIQVNANWQRASSLGDTPLQMTLSWQKGQLGQITKLLTGRDHGWRGSVGVTANLSGTPKTLVVRSELAVEEFRRYDIMSTGVRLTTDCDAHYSTQDGIMRDLSCASAVNGGSLTLRGSFGPLGAEPPYDLTLTAEKLPLDSLLQLFRQTKKGLPADLAASGRLDVKIQASRMAHGTAQFTGEGSAAAARLTSDSGRDEISFGNIPLKIRGANAKLLRGGLKHTLEDAGEARLQIGPVPLAMGAATPASVAAWASAAGYSLSVRGDAEVKALYRLANTLGISGIHPVAEGLARLDVGVSGIWQGFAAPEAVGTAQLQNVRTGMRGLNPPIDISSAVLKLEPGALRLDNISALTGDTHWSGSVKTSRACPAEGCLFEFDLSADQLSSGAFVEWFTPRPAKRPWYRILTSAEPNGKSALLGIRARGRLHVNRMTLKKVAASQITAQVDLDHGKVKLTGLRGQVFQGTHVGEWMIDVSDSLPHYHGNGRLQNVSMAQVSAAMNDPWATGTADGEFNLTTSGATFADLLARSEGELQLTLRSGTFAHVEIPDVARPFPVHLLNVSMNMKSGVWTLSAGKMESHDGLYQFSGTASPGKGLNIFLTRGDDQSWNITGSLLKPKAAHAGRTEARTAVNP